MANIIVCPVCGTQHKSQFLFCPECGCNLSEVKAITVNINPNINETKRSIFKKNVKELGQKAQQGLSNVSNVISEKAKDVSNRASNIVVEEKVTEAMGNLVNLMINVSKDITEQVPTEMLSAIDLEAEINFVAFTIGVSIDLAELNKIAAVQK